jgi:hypothetical protein
MTHVSVREALDIRQNLSTPIVVPNVGFNNSVVVIYKKNLPMTIGIGGNGGLLLCIRIFM